MRDGSTRPTEIEGVDGRIPWQREEGIWSVRQAGPRIVGGLGWPAFATEIVHVKNTDGASTRGPQEIKVPNPPSAVVPQLTGFGKRAFQPLSQWEGVVERVSGSSFLGRIIASDEGANGNFEFIEFSFDELNSESDLPLVQPGAVFYWTVGKSRNSAGTIINASLVRFRRLPATTAHQRREAQREAEELLHKLAPDVDQSGPAGNERS